MMEYMHSGSKIPLHSRQTNTRNLQMRSRNTRTRMDDQRKDYTDSEGPLKGTALNNYRQ